MSKPRPATSRGHVTPPVGATAAPAQYRRLFRDRDDKIVAGVAAGLAEHLRVSKVVVRIVFIALLIANGLGALLYVAFWAVLPVKPRPTDTEPSTRVRRTSALQRLGLGAIALGVIILQAQVHLFSIDPTFVALAAVVALGAGIIWHQADPQRRQRDADTPADHVVGPPGAVASAGADVALGTPPAAVVGTSALGTPVASASAIAVSADVEPVADRRWFFIRVIGGGLLVIIGIIGILGFFAPGEQNLKPLLLGMLFALLALGGLVVALAPVLWRIVSQLREERVARIREQERAEVAAVVHDQVLHTLALIQRNAGDASSVVRLARGQERSLRGWLYKPSGSPSERFAAALEQVAAEVEDTYGISVETVMVGDAEHDDRVAAMVAATREALVNAARHAKVGTVSLYAEAEDEQLSVFVRDRGAGFDLSHVDDDRHGVRGSIIGRMQRHGGVAEVRSSPGEGTEVELTMPRTRRASAGSGSVAGSTTKD
jgi:phage shock protein PspC (stress-responsive transcriptional regulator)